MAAVPTAVRRPDASPTSTSSSPRARPRASTRSAWPPADAVRHDPPAPRASARPPGCTAACSSPTATRRARPTRARPLPGARALVVGARSLPAGRPAARRRRRGPPAGWPATPGPTTTRRCAPALRRRRRAAAGRRAGGPWCVADDNALVDREAAYRAGLGWFGKNANLLLPGRGQLVRARLGRHRRARCRPTAEPVRRRLRRRAAAASTAARPAPSSRPAWSTPAAAWPGCCRPPGSFPRRAPGGARRPHLRLRRLPGGVPAQPRAADAAATRRRRRPSAEAVGRPCSTCSPPTTTSCSTATAAGTSPRRDPASCAATRWWCSATSATAADPGAVAALAAATSADADPMLRAHAVWAARRLGPRPTCSTRSADDPDVAPSSRRADARPVPRVKHLLVTNDFPPKVGGIQSYLWELWRRLPPDDVRRAHHARTTAPRRSTPRSRSGSCARREPVLLPHPVAGAPHRRAWPPRSAPSWSCSTRRCRSGCSGPRLRPAVRRGAARRRGHGPGPAARAAAPLLGRVLRGRAES